MSILQERIKSKRLSLGLTLLEVADLVGVKEATMQRYESGEIKNIKHETIVKLSNIFNCTPQYLMGWANEDESSGDIDKIHIEKYNMLNDDGKAKLNERLDELLELPKYRK
ncbi:MAG: helix-turn-helix domain-containing protein [Oscillospiraceae bacterium]|jgi:transcriptional regulator with XRE-family HTH domain